MRPGSIIALTCFAAAIILCVFLLGTQAGKDRPGFDKPQKEVAIDNESIMHTAREWDFGNPPIKAMEADMRNVYDNLKAAWGLTGVHIDWYTNSGLMKAVGILPDGKPTSFIGRWDGTAWAYVQLEEKK